MNGDTRGISSEEINLETVKSRTVSGIVVLTTRTAILQIISFIAFAIYGALFATAQFGTYAIVLAARNFLGYFSDIGLAGALIQKKDKLLDDDLKTTFLIQQVLVLTLLLVLYLLTPYFKKEYELTQEGVLLLWAFGLSLFLSSLKTIPSILLERKLEFTKLVIPQIVEAVVFNGLVIYLASRGFGLTSFTIAVIAQGVVGLVILYYLAPWTPGIAFSKDSLKSLLKFGIPYQLNTFLAMIKDDGLTLVLGSILGPSGIGLLTWAQKWGLAPLRFFMDQVIKVTFPAFSRLQDNKTELSQAVSRSIFFISFLVFPSLMGLVILSPILTKVVPRYAQWEPALLALSFFAVNAAFAAVSTPLTNLFNAVGKIKITFKLMVMWTVLSWAIMPYLALKYGVSGAAAGSAIVAVSSIIVIFIAKRYVNFRLGTNVVKPLISSLGMGAVLFVIREMTGPSLSWIFILVVFGTLTYLLGILFLIGPSILSDIKKVFYVALHKK